MTSRGYNENTLIEQPAMSLFGEMGWETISAMEETFGCAEPSPQPSPSGRGSSAQTLGRETKGEVDVSELEIVYFEEAKE